MTAYVQHLTEAFRTSTDKREAHVKSIPVLTEMADDRGFLLGLLRRHIVQKGCLNTRHYPVLAFNVAHTPYFSLIVNCWIPHPDGRDDISTKAIHHHGELLLSTVTSFGPGYEHWLFELPEPVDVETELFSTRLIERAAHPLHHASFVDSYTCHLPVYPPSLSITLALWSTSTATTWRDHLKTMPTLQRNRAALRRVLQRVGLAKALELKLVEYFDFFPSESGFVGMKDRIEFALGPNDDYLYSLFHVLQETGNESLVPDIRDHVEGAPELENRQLVKRLLDDLDAGNRIEGRLSDGHYDVPHANFTTSSIERALAAGTSAGRAAAADR